jgi:hypothetical protein
MAAVLGDGGEVLPCILWQAMACRWLTLSRAVAFQALLQCALLPGDLRGGGLPGFPYATLGARP